MGMHIGLSSKLKRSPTNNFILTILFIHSKLNIYFRNQWSKSWGVNSFGLISRNITNNCGISSYAFAPLLYDKNYTFTDLNSKLTWNGTGLF